MVHLPIVRASPQPRRARGFGTTTHDVPGKVDGAHTLAIVQTAVVDPAGQ